MSVQIPYKTKNMLADFGIQPILEDDINLYRRYKEEMVSGFTGLPSHGKHRMLLLCVYYNEVFMLQQLVTTYVRQRCEWFD